MRIGATPVGHDLVPDQRSDFRRRQSLATRRIPRRARLRRDRQGGNACGGLTESKSDEEGDLAAAHRLGGVVMTEQVLLCGRPGQQQLLDDPTQSHEVR